MHVNSWTLQIAGVRFKAVLPVGVRLRALGPEYDEFTRPSSFPPASVTVSVSVEVGSPPDLARLPRVFTAPDAWELFSDGRVKCFVFQGGNPGGPPAWAARFDPHDLRATVWCGDRLVAGRGDAGVELFNPLAYPLDQILVMNVLAARGGVVVHSAGAVVAGKACVLAGRSGAGKTTVARGLDGVEGFELLSDDRCVIRRGEGGLVVCGTPWAGEAGIARNRSAPLGGVLFLRQAAGNGTLAVTKQEARDRLLPVCSIPWYDEDLMSVALEFCDEILDSVPVRVLDFRPGPDVAACIRDLAAGD